MKKTKYISLGFKFSLMVFIMIFLSASVIGVMSYISHKDSVVDLTAEHALGVARATAISINGDKFQEIDKLTKKTEYYNEMLDNLCEVKVDSDFVYVYTMSEADEENFKYIADGFLPDQVGHISQLGDLEPKSEYGEEPVIAMSGEGATSEIYYWEGTGYLISAFYPIMNSNNQVVGVVGVDIRADHVLTEAKAYIPRVGFFIIASSIILFLISSFFIRRSITKPLNTLMNASNQLAVGDTNVSIIQKSQDEIGQLMGAFGRMVQNIEQQSDNLRKIALGDLSVDIIEKSENDVLAKSMSVVVDNLNNLNQEVTDLTKAITAGELSKKADSSQLKGSYKEFVDGINDIQDSFINVLDSIETSIVIVDDEYNLKFANSSSYEGKHEDRESVIGKKYNEVFNANRELNQFEQCIKENRKQTFEEADNESESFYQIDMSPYNDKEDNIRGVIEVKTDISELKQAEEVVQKQLNYQKNEIDKVIDNLNSLAQGNLDIETFVEESDKDTQAIAENFILLNSSLTESTQTMKLMIDEASEFLFRMSNKDFSEKIERDYVGDFTKLKDSINHIVDQFNVILSEINTAADQVEAGAEQVASSSQNLSQGASEQASSVEEIGATVTEVADQTNENAKNADKANELSLRAKEGAQIGNDQMQSMLLSMNDIKDSSENIANIIKVIEEIAFQTNILALNAAVEAARAGEHGKGFAVVAEEVRNLAARSAKAAKETTDLIDNSINKVEDGYQIANDTAIALNKIVNAVSDAVDIVGLIADASNNQATAISEINRGIEQISEATQNNTATAEESASTSEEMAGQAQILKGLVESFKLVNDSIETKKDKNNLKKIETEFQEISLDEGFGKY